MLSVLKNHVALLTGLLSLSVLAADVNVTVEVVGPSCTVNNGEIIEVDFGDDILSTRISGFNYSKNFGFRLQCSASAPSTVYLMIQGEQREPGIQILKTSTDNLDIMFYRGSNLVYLNEKVAVNKDDHISFSAILRSMTMKKIQAGPFSAVATIVVHYE